MFENDSETDGGALQNFTFMEDVSSKELADLLPTLMQIFLTIMLGWLAGFYKIIPKQESKGLNLFVGKFSLPVLIFVSLASLNFKNIEWSFLLAITISKSIIFVVVGVIEFVIHSPKDLSRASIFAIFCTQTNDFGMGLPILDAVYGHDHPFVGLLYLVAPISLLILNPIGFVFMEAEKNSATKNSGILAKMKTFLVVLRALMMNPIIAMTVLGVLANPVFKGNLPTLFSKFLIALGAAFTSMAPFTLGLGMVGKFGNIRGDNLKPIIALVVTKSILTPILTHFLVEQMSLVFTGSKDPALSNFGFLYGTFPTALGVDSYAGQYNVNPDLISAAIVLCTLFSAPLMYVSANILTVLDLNMDQYLVNLMNFQFNICMFSIFGVMFISLIFIMSKRYLNVPHTLTMSMLYLSLQTAVGGSIWAAGIKGSKWIHYMEVILHVHGLYSLRISTAVLSVSLLLICSGYRQLVEKIKFLLVLTGPLLAGVAVTVLATTLSLVKEFHTDPMLAFGPTQDYVSLGILSGSMIVTVVCLILKQRLENDEEASKVCDEESDKLDYSHTPQMFRHTILMMLLCCSMFSGICVSITRVAKVFDTEGSFPGVYKVLAFLDTILASGHGILFLAVFILDCRFILLPMRTMVSYVTTKIKGEKNNLPSFSD